MKKDYLLKRVFKFDGVTSLRTLVIEWPVYDKLGDAMDQAYNEANHEFETLDFDVEDAQCISSDDGKRIYRDAMDYYPGVA